MQINYFLLKCGLWRFGGQIVEYLIDSAYVGVYILIDSEDRIAYRSVSLNFLGLN